MIDVFFTYDIVLLIKILGKYRMKFILNFVTEQVSLRRTIFSTLLFLFFLWRKLFAYSLYFNLSLIYTNSLHKTFTTEENKCCRESRNSRFLINNRNYSHKYLNRRKLQVKQYNYRVKGKKLIDFFHSATLNFRRS